MPDEPNARPTRATRSRKADPAASPAPRATRRAVAVPVVGDPPETAGGAESPATTAALATTPATTPASAEAGPDGGGPFTIRQGGIGSVAAAEVSVNQGGIGAVRAGQVSVEIGGVGAAMTDQLTVRQGLVGAAIANAARFEQAGVRTLVANRVEFGPNSGAAVVIAARVEGDVRPLLDWRGALAFGVAAGLVGALLRVRRR